MSAGKLTEGRSRCYFARGAIIILLFALAGCGEEADDPGDAQLGALEIKHSIFVTSLSYPLETAADQPLPGTGMQFVQVAVEVKNESGRELIISPANLTLEAEDGSSYSVNLDFDGEELLPTVVTVPPADTVSGLVIYEIPLEAKPVAVIEDIGGRQNRIELPATGS